MASTVTGADADQDILERIVRLRLMNAKVNRAQMVVFALMLLLVINVTVHEDIMDHVVSLTSMNAEMSLVEMEEPVRMDSMSIFANADQDTKDANVKEK